ncbi:unnamed protein product [Phaedon cochleariae]|uniref:Zinc finger protein Rlf/292/654 TPR repeats domain-containing protein n=1 Tax=Phaedon cochleariae TaxID=80249 RepID=A0A9P0GTE9_PHACE|nr:unnamed protein product [Phaedon cochleariae]
MSFLEDLCHLAPFKKLEFILNNKNESFQNKVESIVEVWKIVGELNLSQFGIHHVIQILDWAKLHALNIVLTAEWNEFKPNYEPKLLEEIARAESALSKLNSAFATRCKKLADVVRNPWEDTVLMRLMKTKDAEIGPEEVEFFCVETAYLVSVRLKKLCESHCEDLALNLVTAFMNCNKLSKTQNFSVNATESQMWFIFDIYIALLYKFQHRQTIVVLLKELAFDEGLQLVRRFANKRVKISKIWKNCHRVAILGAQMYISQAVVKYAVELKTYLESFLEIYISLCTKESLLQDFPTSIRRISNLADADGLYVFCDVIQKKAGTELKPFVVELYIRALTTDMNELERQKDSDEPEKAAATTSRLAAAFCNLADFLDEHVKVARECILTAFSLEPTKDRMAAIENLARRSGFQVLDTGQEWKCKLHPPTLPSDDVTWVCPECGDWMCNPDFTAPTKINMALNEALQNSVLGITEALCDDLVVCLSNPRYQILSWFLPWDDLHRLCKMYLQDPQTTKNFVTELKFVDIDYSIFKGIKREPLDELAGIERGYEQYLDHNFVSGDESDSEDSLSQDSRPYSLGSDGAGEGPYLPLLPPQPKSDPNTLKSLRMFRPNLKRVKDKEPSDVIAEKLFKSDSNNVLQEVQKPDIASLSEFLNGVCPAVSQTSLPSITLSDNSNSSGIEDSQSKNVKTATLSLLGGQVAEKETPIIQVPQILKSTIPRLEDPFLKETRHPASEQIKDNVTSTMEITQDPPNPQKELLPNGMVDDNNYNQVVAIREQGFCLPCRGTRVYKIKMDKQTQSLPIMTTTIVHTPQLPVSIPISQIFRLHLGRSLLNATKQTRTNPTVLEESLSRQQPINNQITSPHFLLLKKSPNQNLMATQLALSQSLIHKGKIQTDLPLPSQLLLPGLELQVTLPNHRSALNDLPLFSKEDQLKPLAKANQNPTLGQLKITLVNISKLKQPILNREEPALPKEDQCQIRLKKEQTPNRLEKEESPLRDMNLLRQTLGSLEQQVLPKVGQQPNQLKQGELSQVLSHLKKKEPSLVNINLKQPFVSLEQLVPSKENPSSNQSDKEIPQKQEQHPEKKSLLVDVNKLKQPFVSLEQLVPPSVDQPPNHPERQEQPHVTRCIQNRASSTQYPIQSHKINQLVLNLPLEVRDHPVLGPNQKPSDSYSCQSLNLSTKTPANSLVHPEKSQSNEALINNSIVIPKTYRLRTWIRTKWPTYLFQGYSSLREDSSKLENLFLDSTMSDIKHHFKHINQLEDSSMQEKINQLEGGKQLVVICQQEDHSKQENNQSEDSKQLEDSSNQLKKNTKLGGGIKSEVNNQLEDSDIQEINQSQESNLSGEVKQLKVNILKNIKVEINSKLENSYTPEVNSRSVSNSKLLEEIEQLEVKEENKQFIIKEESKQLEVKVEIKQLEIKEESKHLEFKEESKQLEVKEEMIQLEVNTQPEPSAVQLPEEQNQTSSSPLGNMKLLDVRIEVPRLELWTEKALLPKTQADCSKQHCSLEHKKLVVNLDRLQLRLPSQYETKYASKDQSFQTSQSTKQDQLQKQVGQMKQKRLQDISCSLPKVRKLSQSSDKPKIKTTHNSPKRPLAMPLKQLQAVSVVLDKMPVTKIPQCSISMEQCLDQIQYRCIPSRDMGWAKWEGKCWPGLIQTNLDPYTEVQQEHFPKPSRFRFGNQMSCVEMMNSSAILEATIRNEEEFSSEKNLHERDKVRCNNDVGKDSNMVVEINGGDANKIDEYLFEDVSQSELQNSDVEIFSSVFGDKMEKLIPQDNNDYTVRDAEQVAKDSEDELPKNLNLTENIRTYVNKSKKPLATAFKDCVNALTGDDKLDVCKNVNSINKIDSHSSVQIGETKPKELKVILDRLPSNKKLDGKCTSNKEEYPSIKSKCDRGRTPPKNAKRRRSMDKSENKAGKAPNLVQNNNFSPLQDANIRVNPRVYSRACCDLNKQKALNMSMTMCVDKAEERNYAKSILANVPGLDNFQMMRPLNVSPIVNVVQISGGRQAQNVPIQNTQTSTQVTPHIQRIGQPRISDQKPENSSVTSSIITTSTTTTTIARTATTQPSTLINILSQQIIRPVSAQNNPMRRQPPLINILSQQIIRPSIQGVKTVTNSIVPAIADTNQVKPVVTTEPIILNQTNNIVKTTTAPAKNPNTVTPGQGSTILQFICKSSLPKFQQAFGKTVYQNNSESTDSPSTTVETTCYNATVDTKPKVVKSVPVNIQPIQGSVIYSRQVPVGQTISLIPNSGTTRQVFRIATSNPEQLSLVKDSVIHSKMSALLAAALQGRPKNAEGEVQVVNSDDAKGTITRPTLVQSARIVKPVQLQLQPNTVKTSPQTNLSSTTLEQLREFDMVYKQIKERSSTTTTEGSSGSGENQEVPQQRISVTYVNQLPKYTQLSPVVVVTSYSSLQPAASPALSVTSQGSSSPCVTPASTPTLPKVATKPSSKGKTLKTSPPNNTVATKSSPIPKPQQKPQEDEHTTQRIFDILAEYAEQLRNSPDLNNKPAPRRRSNPPTNPNHSSKRKKSSSNVKKSGQSSSSLEMDTDDVTIGSEDSSGGGVLQLSVTDDEQSQAATVNANDSNLESTSSPPSSRPVILAEGATCGTQSRNLIIADSSVGEALKMPNTAVIVPGSYIMPVSMVKGGQQIAVVSGGSKILATVPARSGQNMVFFQSFMNQNRKGAISAVKYSTIQPISGISSQSLAGVSAQPPVILPSTVALGQPLTLKKYGDDREGGELLLTISQPKESNSDQNDIPQPDSSTSVSSDSVDIKIEDSTIQGDHHDEKIFHGYQKSVITNSVGTSVIATTSLQPMKEHENHHIINLTSTNSIKVEPKSGERMQSVLVTACSSNGPMLSHTTPRYRKPMDIARTNNNEPMKEEFLNNGEKLQASNEQKTFRSNTTYYVNKMKKINAESNKIDSEMQKQAAIERELRLQKSLSEECEDLGVDEPSTSDLFPEADLLFDSNHSPSFDQTSQDIIKRAPQNNDKEDVKDSMNLFSDDENSSSLRTDLFEYVEYQTVETALDYQARQLMNGNNTESGSSGCEDNTLLAKCATMSEVTLNSPISPEMYQESSLHKYKFKYSNRKKGEKMRQSDFGGEVVSSSEDTVGSTELGKINCDEDNYKVVHVAITKTDIMKDEEKCELHCDGNLDSTSGRGARRSVRKLCSCCNGSQDGSLAKKRPPTSRPHTPAAPHKKAFLSKKR